MKKLYTILIALLVTGSTFAQAPEKMSYQAVVRDAANTLVTNQSVGMQISILQTTPMGTAVYIETQTPTTNVNGLVTLEIGGNSATVVSGTFSTIDWGAGPYFIKTETDPSGGSSYTITGTSQLMSVPYALYAKTSGNGQGPAGADGTNGTDGVDGTNGTDGSSAYDVAVANGFVGTEAAWLLSLDGTDGTNGAAGQGGVTTAGTGISVTGAGTVGSPYMVSTTSPCSLSIGQTYQGGIIFYLDASGCHGLISAATDQSTGIQWYNGSTSDTNTFASCVGCGDGNTSKIVYYQGSGSYAANLCYDLSLEGYDDWYLPSKYELNLMYQNIGHGNALGLGNVGGFANTYWSSTEYGFANAWGQIFDNNNGYQFAPGKERAEHVRAVRAF
jgi:hypothetical protein